MVHSVRRVAIVGAAVVALALASVGIVTATPTTGHVLDRSANGIVDNNGIHGIIIVNSYTDGSSNVTLSLHGLSRVNAYHVVGSAIPCSNPNTDRATIFAIVIVNSKDPFKVARKGGIHDQLAGLVSLRVLETSPAARQLVCVPATNLVAR